MNIHYLTSTLILCLLPIISISALTHITTNERLLLSSNTIYRPLVTKTYDQLIYVSFPRDPNPKIRIESELIGYKACNIDLPITTDYSQQNPISLDSLANGKLILTIQSTNEILNIVIDPDSCSSWSVITYTELQGAENPIVVVGEDAFDLFLPRHENCSFGMACRLRYNQRAVLVGTTDFQFNEDSGFEWIVNSVDEKDVAGGYFLTVFTDSRAVVIKMNQDLKIEQKRDIGKPFLHSDLFGQISSCRTTSKQVLDCTTLNNDLIFKQRTIIDTHTYRNYIRTIKLLSLPSDTGSLLYIVLQLDGSNKFDSYLQRIDAYGRVGRPLLFQEHVCKDVGGISLSRMNDEFVCISHTCRYEIRTKCVMFID